MQQAVEIGHDLVVIDLTTDIRGVRRNLEIGITTPSDYTKVHRAVTILIGIVIKAISIGLRHGVPIEAYADGLEELVRRFGTRAGTSDRRIPSVRNALDYLVQWIRLLPQPKGSSTDGGQNR